MIPPESAIRLVTKWYAPVRVRAQISSFARATGGDVVNRSVTRPPLCTTAGPGPNRPPEVTTPAAIALEIAVAGRGGSFRQPPADGGHEVASAGVRPASTSRMAVLTAASRVTSGWLQPYCAARSAAAGHVAGPLSIARAY